MRWWERWLRRRLRVNEDIARLTKRVEHLEEVGRVREMAVLLHEQDCALRQSMGRQPCDCRAKETTGASR